MLGNVSTGNETTVNSPVLIFNIYRSIFATLYFIIFVLGVGGNAPTCYILFRRPKHTATTIFLINLSVADMMMALFCVPVTLISDCIYQRWVFGSIMCHVFPFIQGLSVFLCALTHVVISLDRYFVVFHPLRRQNFPLSGAFIVICSVWIFSIVFSSPMVYVSIIKPSSNGDLFCREQWGHESSADIYSIVGLVFQYILPLIVILISYFAIAQRIWFHHQPGESIRERDEAIMISKRKMIKMFILVATFYTLSQLPRHIIFLMTFNHQSDLFWNESNIWIMNLTHLLSMSACFYNPLLYIWLNASFRMKFQSVLSCNRTNGSGSGTGERGLTFQDNSLMLRRMHSLSCNHAIMSMKSVERRI